MMRKRTKIILKGSFFRKLRSNLRYILYNSISSELKHLDNLTDLYRGKKRNITQSQMKRMHFLMKKSDELFNVRRNSILECSASRCEVSTNNSRFDIDMVYEPINKEWYCLSCYQRISENLNPNNWFNKGRIINDNAEKPCLILEWCPYGYYSERFYIRIISNIHTCMVFGHDCPVFYISEAINENSQILVEINKLDEKEYVKFKLRQKYFNKNFEKPCHSLQWCPYGPITYISKMRNNNSKFTCKIFKRDCPVYYLGEYVSEGKM